MARAKAIVERYWQLLDEGRMAELRELVTPDVEFRTPLAVVQGPDALLRVFQSYRVAFPHTERELISFVEDGSAVALEMRVRARLEGPFVGPGGAHAVAGSGFDIQTCDIIRLREDRILTWRAFYDGTALLTQLGIGAEPARSRSAR